MNTPREIRPIQRSLGAFSGKMPTGLTNVTDIGLDLCVRLFIFCQVSFKATYRIPFFIFLTRYRNVSMAMFF